MANSLKLLSWNIQKFGEQKLNDPNVIHFICTVIRTAKADVVGLMELVGWQGNETRDKLVAALNNLEALAKSGVQWNGAASEMTPARPNEQYLFLWKTHLVQSATWALWNVISEELFNDFFKTNNFNQAMQETFWGSLFNNNWIDAAFQLKPAKRALLKGDYTKFDLSQKAPSVSLSNPQKKVIVDLLLQETPVTFPMRGSRPPFVLGVVTAGTNVEVLIVLFHAPGPGNGLPVLASNMLAFMPPVQTTQVGVVMGDFNIDANDSSKLSSLPYWNNDTGRLDYVRAPNNIPVLCCPFQRLTGPDFTLKAADPALTQVQKYSPRLASAKTSISTTLVGNSVIADDTTVQSILSSEYDRFFVRAAKADPSPAVAWNLMDAMVPKTVPVMKPNGTVVQEPRSKTSTTYVPDLAVAASRAFDNWWDYQNNKKRKSDATQKLLAEAPKLGPNVIVGTLRQAQYCYRNAISDHLPILMELQYA